MRTLRNLKAFFLCIFGGGAQQKVRELFILFTKKLNSNLMCDFRLFVRHSCRFDNNSESIPYDTAKQYLVEVTTISHGDRLSFSEVDINLYPSISVLEKFN